MNTHLLVSSLLVVATACGGKTDAGYGTPTSPGATGAVPVAGPMPYVATMRSVVTAPVMIPEALSSLEWPAPPINRSLSAQRRRFAAAGPDARQAEAANLATALWYSEPSDTAAEGAARAAARTILRDMAMAGGASETVLSMLTVAERALGDAPASEPIYDELILRFPQSPRTWRYRAVRSWLDLRAHRVQRASEIIDGADLAAAATPSAVHYVAGWIALRQGDLTRAHAELVTAIQRWGDLWSWDTVRNEAFQIGALAGATPDYMQQIASEIVNGPPQREAGTVNKRIRTTVRSGRTVTTTEETKIDYSRAWLHVELGRAYATWGRIPEATAIYKLALGDEPYTDAIVNHELMKLALATNQPVAVVTHARASITAIHKAMAESSANGVGELDATLKTDIARLAREFATFARLTGLVDYQDAGFALAALIGSPLPTPSVPSTAAYQPGVLDTQLAWTWPRLVACYAGPVQRQAAFGGTIQFTLTPGPNGAATLTNLSPAAGEGGLAAVAGCVAGVIASWRMTGAPDASTTMAHVELSLQAAL